VTATYAELLEQTERIARAQCARGVCAGERVATLLANVPAMLQLHYAVPGIGASLVPLNTRLFDFPHLQVQGPRCSRQAAFSHPIPVGPAAARRARDQCTLEGAFTQGPEVCENGTLSLMGLAPSFVTGGAIMFTLFCDRFDAGRRLGVLLEQERGPDAVVVGLARGGVQAAAEVADVLHAPLDVVTVRKVGHPWQPDYAIGAVAPGYAVYVRSHYGLSDDDLQAAVEAARGASNRHDRRMHRTHPVVDLHGKAVLLVDDGLATGATMIAAIRWARTRHARTVVAVVPMAPTESASLVRLEADDLVCPWEVQDFLAIGLWYETFPRVEDLEVLRLLDKAAGRPCSKPS
jgi:putative phosphoribosyl transferase